jgi:hypothetical protein
LESREGNLQLAANDLKEAVRTSPDDLRSAEELVAVLRALGQTSEAEGLARQWLARFPTSYFLREELRQPDNPHLGADVDRILNTAAEYMRLGLYSSALDVLSRAYPQVPADQREPAEALPQDHPLVAYYRGYCRQKLGKSPADDYAAAARLSTKYVFPAGAMTYKVLQSALRANPKDANAIYLEGTLEFSIGLIDRGLDQWAQAQELNPKIPALDADIGRALLRVKRDPEGALAAFQRGTTTDDPTNLGNYFGLDQALSLLKRPAAERVAAIGHYPDVENMPADLVYEYALNLAEAGDFDRALGLFRNRFFMRAEGGTNVRQVWIEVRLQQALELADQGHCEPALKIVSQLGAAVPGLDFTQDGLQPILDTARNAYLAGRLEAGCGLTEQAKARFEQAASVTDPGQAAWASMAAKRLDGYDQAQWRARLLSTLGEGAGATSSLRAYNQAMVQRELGNESAAEAGFRQALTMPDSQMAYHLSRLALAHAGN